MLGVGEERAMRWGAFLGMLPELEAPALVNALTVAGGHAMRATRQMARDAPAGVVLDAWGRTAAALVLARRLLAGVTLAEVGDLPPPAVPSLSPEARPWGTLLPRTSATAITLLALLAAAAADIRAARADADVERVRLPVVGAVAALADARHLLGSAS